MLAAGYFALVERRAGIAAPDVLDTPESDLAVYAARANRVAVRNRPREVVAVVEIISPGDKGARHASPADIDNLFDMIPKGVHLLVIDLFPPMTVAAHRVTAPRTAYVEPIAVGDELPDLPLFLAPGEYVPAPLSASYAATWAKCPEVFRDAVDPPADSVEN